MNYQVESTTYCNLICRECPHHLMKRPNKHMSLEIFDVILNDYMAQDPPNTIIFHKDGDPLMNPKLATMISKASSQFPDSKLDLYINGLLLTPAFVDFLGGLPNRIWILISLL
jgi:MoaA/NifB/PqqE/SkfB family radical SAM enzyme